MSIFTQFSGSGKTPRSINLGNASSTNATSVLAAARAERQAREVQRIQTQAVVKIQRVWRGRRVAGRVKRQILYTLASGGGSRMEGEDTDEISIADLNGQNRARGLLVVFWNGIEDPLGYGKQEALDRWCKDGLQKGGDGVYAFLQPLRSNGNYLYTMTFLLVRLLNYVLAGAASPSCLSQLEILEAALERRNYDLLGTSGERAYQIVCGRLISQGWVESLSQSLRSLTPNNKKHPAIPPLVRLIVKTSTIPNLSQTTRNQVNVAIFRYLLTIPSLPSSLPLGSLTHLCIHLPFFQEIFPSALSHGINLSEMATTELIANLVTIIVRGGLLAKQDTKGIAVWMRLLTSLLDKVGDQWGLWIESKGRWAPNHSKMIISPDQGSDDSDAGPSENLIKRPRLSARGTVSPALLKRIIPVLSVDHLSQLANSMVRNSELTIPFCQLILSLLNAFRGSARWEGILDTLLTSDYAVQLLRDLWRSNVRGKWPSSSAMHNWETLLQPNTARTVSLVPPFLLLSTLLIQHLLTIPDDEFFAPVSSKSALSLDEILELAGVWKDLGFYGYWSGLAPPYANKVEPRTLLPKLEKQREDIRSLMTQGVVAICARDARRPFAPRDFWIMTGEIDLPGFVEAVIIEERQLEFGSEDDEDMERDSQERPTGSLPPWMRSRRQISKRQMALISPRLGLLNNLPMTISFETRVEILNRFIYNDHEKLGIDRYIRRQGMRHRATIRRGKISEDGFDELDKLGPMLKGTIEIQFIDEWGQPEAGIDGGGLFKEFLTSLSTEAFDTNRGLWLATDRNELYPNPHSYAREPHQLNWYSFIGRVLGKALYEGILVDVTFAGFFLAKWLGRQSYLDDLASLDHELYRGLISLKNYPGDCQDLALTFSIDEEEFGTTQTVDLVPNGSDVAVTNLNKTEYIQLVCDYKLNRRIAPQCKAFFDGLSDIIDPKWLRMFDQQELQTLIGGTEAPIDVDDLQRNTVTPDGADDVSLELFWKVIRQFSQKDLKALLKFVTSTPNPPLLGFKYLNPNFGIRLAGNDTTRLPSASSCANLLKLPRYKDEHTLRSKLLQAINSNAGFDLS